MHQVEHENTIAPSPRGAKHINFSTISRKSRLVWTNPFVFLLITSEHHERRYFYIRGEKEKNREEIGCHWTCRQFSLHFLRLPPDRLPYNFDKWPAAIFSREYFAVISFRQAIFRNSLRTWRANNMKLNSIFWRKRRALTANFMCGDSTLSYSYQNWSRRDISWRILSLFHPIVKEPTSFFFPSFSFVQ